MALAATRNAVCFTAVSIASKSTPSSQSSPINRLASAVISAARAVSRPPFFGNYISNYTR